MSDEFAPWSSDKKKLEKSVSKYPVDCQKIMIDHNLAVEDINNLPENVRKYIADLETNCDPAGMVAESGIISDLNGIFEKVIEVQKKKIDAFENTINSISKVPYHKIEIRVGSEFIGFTVKAYELSEVEFLIDGCRRTIKELDSGE
jgi:hypothetical protein